MKLSDIAVQLYTLRDYCRTGEQLRETLLKVKEIGYQSVQLSGLGPINPEEVKRHADEAGLVICATHVDYNSLKHKLDDVVRQHKLWNCRYVGLGGIPAEYRSGEGYAAFAKEASEIGKRLKEHGLQFIYHNHKFEFEKYDGRTGMAILLEESDRDAFGFELDTYWVQAGGADPVEWIRRVEGRMGVIHLKDMAIVDDKQIFAEIGEGNLNFEQIVQACRETGVEWYVVEQDQCRRDPFESLAISLNNLKKLL
ncbi:sugar phosphate isomerase [Paenibacillus cisolokensis]|jgi:Sugar phosphate isomerases/epimerases|uniref:Sugar phosphate isomerase n=1 Tax=Paenibacillus cisolokensis TaxID=1658519 RepID=A0ABQ4N554_9BACL|nr:sugar phosphate isomerase/epimerase [Paenibacillus cisolokensis]GIQ63287.1 sugar phosphate isomerase [Paenibacillus cisolokensis]